MKTLETKNLELKYTNKNLINTLSEQKNLLKTLKSKIIELESSKDEGHDYEKINTDHLELLDKYKKLQIKYKKTQEELSQLKKMVPESKTSNGLLGRFLKRKSSADEDENLDDGTDTK